VIVYCALVALALFAHTAAATKGGTIIITKSMGSGKGGHGGGCKESCKDVCEDVCKPVDVEVCKDVEVPYEVCKDVTTTVTEQKCSKVCGGGGDAWDWGGKKGRKLQGGKAGKLITVVVSKPSCSNVCKDVNKDVTKAVCKTMTKTEKKCTTISNDVCSKSCKKVCTSDCNDDGGKGWYAGGGGKKGL